jgi:hypothetical protein
MVLSMEHSPWAPRLLRGRRLLRGPSLNMRCELQNIVRVNEDSADRVRYGLASFRWFHTRSFLFDDSDEESDASKADVGLAKYAPGLVSNYFGTDLMSRFAG